MAQESARIVQEVHDEPHVRGSRVSVRHIYRRVHEAGLPPEDVADRLDLDTADVYHALAYYHDHPAEMAAVERQRDAAVAEAAERTTIPPQDQ